MIYSVKKNLSFSFLSLSVLFETSTSTILLCNPFVLNRAVLHCGEVTRPGVLAGSLSEPDPTVRIFQQKVGWWCCCWLLRSGCELYTYVLDPPAI